MFRDREFDICEQSLASYIMDRSTSDEFIATPVFPRRLFSQNCIFVNVDAGIERPIDLIGKKVEFFTNGELGKPIGNVADYSLDTEIGLRYKVTEWASLNVKAEKDVISGSDYGNLNKTRYTAGFGVAW